MALSNENVIVIGHKNPDTDSVCSAIAYAYLKNKVSGTENYVAGCAGNINGETAYVLDTFAVPKPLFFDDITKRLFDVEYERIEGIPREASLREAWNEMRRTKMSTMPIVRHGRLEGLITMEDIALSYMETMNPYMISEAHTKFQTMADTIGGKVVVGNNEEYYTKGKILIAAANPDYMESCMEEGDLIILTKRQEMLERALECKAGCIIVCTVDDIEEEWKEKAKACDTSVICVNKDTYSVSKLLEQSMPVSYFMTREDLITFHMDQLTADVKEVLSKHRFKNYPVLDSKNKYSGMISRRHLINEQKRKVILVDHQETTQAVDGLENAEILEVIDHHKIGDIQTLGPIYFRNQPLGCTATILTQMFDEQGVEIPRQIAGLLLSAILSDTLLFRSPTCTKLDESYAYRLAKIAQVDVEEHAMAMFKAGSNFADRSIDAIFFQDFKKFQAGEITFGVGQVNIMSEEEGEELKQRVIDFITGAGETKEFDMVFFMMTNIFTEVTDLIYAGKDAAKYLEEAFNVIPEEHSVLLPNVLSRKKQLLPPLISVMSEQ
jgi:manganese-dependent inorganic pyrophosphatase